MKLKRKDYLVAMIIELVSVILTSLCLVTSRNNDIYRYIFVLPLSYTVITAVFIQSFKDVSVNISKLAVILLYFIKDCFSPSILGLGNYVTAFTKITQADVNFAISLMVYEYIVVILVLLLTSYNRITFVKRTIKLIKDKEHENTGIWLLLLLAILCGVSYVFLPSIRANYSSIFKATAVVGLENSNIYSVGSLKRVLNTLFVFLFPFTLELIVACFVWKIWNKYGDTLISLFMSFICIAFLLFFISEDTMFSLINIFVILIGVIKLYKRHRKLIIGLTCTIGTLAILLISVAKSQDVGFDANPMTMISYMFQSYFPGVANTAGVHGFVGKVPKLLQFWYEIYNAIPFKTTLFGKVYDRLVIDYCVYNDTVYMLIPEIAQSYYFWGFFLAPIEIVIILRISMVYYEKACAETNFLRFITYFLISFYSAITPVMYNSTNLLYRFTNVFFPMIILVRFTGRMDWYFDNETEFRGISDRGESV